MDKTQKLKNIYDLKYTQTINYQSIYLVLLGTTVITLWFSNFGLAFVSSLLLKLIVTLLAVFIGFLIMEYYNSRLDIIKNCISNL